MIEFPCAIEMEVLGNSFCRHHADNLRIAWKKYNYVTSSISGKETGPYRLLTCTCLSNIIENDLSSVK